MVVLHYSGVEDTVRCVQSLAGERSSARILVVDNGSGDSIRERIEETCPGRTEHVRLTSNTGFTGGMNAGLAWAFERHARTITVLNNDTVVSPGAIDALCAVAAAGHVLVSPEVRYLDDPSSVWFGGAVLDRELALPRHLGEDEIADRFGDRSPREVELISGCCVTATASVWQQLGGFDPLYFLMFEDSDLSVRAAENGVRLLVLPEVTILHAVSASFVGPMHALGLYYYSRNGLHFLRTAVPGSLELRLRFVRRHVLPLLGRPRSQALAPWVRRSVFVATALADASLHRGGRAPRWLERFAGHRATPSEQSEPGKNG
ncbi:hypothetical protein ASH01_15915 [Terrabacter sp. Soil811]|nr:hypothetical protein ASH01_15915 [Terrabacter sp. Soil811]